MATDPAVRDVLIVAIGGRLWGLPSAGVRELLRAVEITPAAGLPGVEGVIDVRGELVPVLDIRGRLGLPPKRVEPSDCLVLVDRGGSAALRVDGVVELIPGPGVWRSEGPGGVAGLLTAGDGALVALLDLDKLLGVEAGGR